MCVCLRKTSPPGSAEKHTSRRKINRLGKRQCTELDQLGKYFCPIQPTNNNHVWANRLPYSEQKYAYNCLPEAHLLTKAFCLGLGILCIRVDFDNEPD